MLDYNFDISHKNDEIMVICGVDEAGRGPFAGPVVAAACILPDGFVIEGLNDSKKLSEKKREELFDIIINNAITSCCRLKSHTSNSLSNSSLTASVTNITGVNR